MLIAATGFSLGHSNIEDKLDFPFEKLNGADTIKNGCQGVNIDLARQDQNPITRAVVARIGLGAHEKEGARGAFSKCGHFYNRSKPSSIMNQTNAHDFGIVVVTLTAYRKAPQ